MEELLRMSHIFAADSSGHRLHDFNMTIFSGELVFLAGAYGSGKHLITNILSGSLLPQSGSVFIDRIPVRPDTKMGTLDSGFFYIDGIYQMADTLSIHDNIFLLRKTNRRKLLYHKKNAFSETRLLLNQVSLPHSPKTRLYELNAFQRLLVCIAKALSYNTRLLILNLTHIELAQNNLDQLSGILHSLKSKGMSCLIIDNKYNPLASAADSAVIINQGTDMKTIRHQAITQPLMNSYFSLIFPKYLPGYFQPDKIGSGKTLLLKHDLQTFAMWTPGTITGVIDHSPDSTQNFYDYMTSFCRQNQAVFTYGSLSENMKLQDHGFRWIPENSSSCLLENLSIADNLLLPRYPKISGICGYIRKDVKAYCEKEFLSVLQLPAASQAIPKSIKNLNQLQKRILSIYRFAIPGTKALFIESPFANLDFAGQTFMHQLLVNISHSGIAVFVISRQVETTKRFCTDIMICRHYRWIETISANLPPALP